MRSSRLHEWMQSPQSTNDFDLVTSPSVNYCNFASDLENKPTPIAVRRISSSHNEPIAISTPIKNSMSFDTSTPSINRSSFNQDSAFNRSANAPGRSQQSLNSNRSMDDSKTIFDVSTGNVKKSHDKSKEKRNKNTTTVCLGDFLVAGKQQPQKQRKSLNAMDRSLASSSITMPHAPSSDKDFPTFTPKGKANRICLTSSGHKSDEKRMSFAEATTPPNSVRRSNQAADIKKRVAPTRISTSVSAFNCPAFRSENNILELPHEENADTARDILKAQKDIIRREFQEEEPLETNLRTILRENLCQEMNMSPVKPTPAIDLRRITHKFLLDKFVAIYSIVLDMNLVANVLTELAYLMNLINVDAGDCMERNPSILGAVAQRLDSRMNVIESTALNEISAFGDSNKLCNQLRDMNVMDAVASGTCANVFDENAQDIGGIAVTLLKNTHNCVYFGIGVIRLQLNILRLLDITTIQVLLQNERLITLNVAIKDDLTAVCSHKMRLENTLRSHNTTNTVAPNTSMKVFYQQEHDTQNNFPTSREFAAFKKQRDTFYSILA